jgi:hypothetical protein
VQDDIAKGTVNIQSAVVVHEAELLEPIHKETDS